MGAGYREPKVASTPATTPGHSTVGTNASEASHAMPRHHLLPNGGVLSATNQARFDEDSPKTAVRARATGTRPHDANAGNRAQGFVVQ
jgi:hypothetical protein